MRVFFQCFDEQTQKKNIKVREKSILALNFFVSKWVPDWIYILCYNAFVDLTTSLLVIHCDFCLFILFTLQTHPCNENRVFPVKFFSQGKTCFHYIAGIPVFITGMGLQCTLLFVRSGVLTPLLVCLVRLLRYSQHG